MDDIDNKLIKYRKSIPYLEANEALKEYYETRDPKLRESLIYRYMPIVKKTALKYKPEYMEEEDIIQMANEILIEAIDEYNPYEDTGLAHYIYLKITKAILKLSNAEHNEISLTNLEISSNANLEDMIISNEEKKHLLNQIYDYLDKKTIKRYTNIIKSLYGIDCEKQTSAQICENEGISDARLHEIKYRILFRLYYSLLKDSNYHPIEKIENPVASKVYFFDKQLRKEIDRIDFSKMEYLTFYDDCDTLADSHRLIRKK